MEGMMCGELLCLALANWSCLSAAVRSCHECLRSGPPWCFCGSAMPPRAVAEMFARRP